MDSNLDLKALQTNQNLKARNYWKNRLSNFEFNTYFDSADNAVATAAGQAGHVSAVPAHTAARLAAVAGTDKATHVVLLAALGILLQKCSSVADICVFTPVYSTAGRAASSDELVPVRLTNFAGYSAAEFVSVVKQDLAQDFTHAGFPLRKKLAATAADPEQIASVVLVLESIQELPAELPFADSLVFSFANGPQPVLTIRYSPAKFDADFIAQLASLYFNVLAQLLANGRTLVRDIAAITPAETELITKSFNDTAVYFPADTTVIDFFLDRAAESPEQVAVVGQDESLTYRELDARSNQVANFLLANYPCQGMIVGVLLDRCADLMPIIFGILKAGCVYLPLSTHYPEERNKYILDDSQAPLIFTHADASYHFPGIRCVDIRAVATASTAPCNKARPEAIAYIIYTSGSTGQPKGVMIKHVSITNRLYWMQRKYQLTPADTILQKTPLVFDVSVWELFWWAIAGAKLVLAPVGAEKDPEQLCDIIQQEAISVLHFVPSMLHTFLDYLQYRPEKNPIQSVRHLFTSGEELKAADGQGVFQYGTAVRVHNLYGPTEATVDVSFHEVQPGAAYRTVPIGKPIDNTSLLIFNKDGQLQPVGIPGELYIGGVNVAVGYLNKEALTQEKFVKSPLDGETILYRTGDLAKWQPDGEIVFLGRIDNQVKIRGNRIELGDIEFAINAHESVGHAVVLATENNGVLQLAAYVVPNAAYTEDTLIEYLAAKLPEYMIPAHFFTIEEVPVTVNGKLDRKKLLAVKKVVTRRYVAPATEAEAKMLAIWQRVLPAAEFGVEDNFFRSGGDSIFAVKLVGTINNELGLKLSLADLYKSGTVRLLAAHADQPATAPGEALHRQAEQELELFQAAYARQRPADAAVATAYPLNSLEQYIAQCQRERPEDGLYFKQTMQPVTYVNFRVEALQQALDILVQKHEVLRMGFDTTQGARLIYATLRVPIRYQDLSGLSYQQQRETVQEYLEHSRSLPLFLDQAPLWQLTVYKLGESHHELLFEHYGGMLDGWSMNALIAELNELYLVISRGQEISAQPLQIGYREVILQEMAHVHDARLRQFWQEELRGYKKLQFNHDTGPRQFTSVRTKSPAQLVAQLAQAAKERETSVKNVLFAAYVHSLWALTGERDLVVGLLSFNRPAQEDGDKVLGCFLNPIPVRIQVPVESTWKQWLQLVDQKLSALKPYEMLPLSDIIQAAGETPSGANPLFDTVFNFVRWHLLEAMELDTMHDVGVERLDFDTYSRRDTSFDVNYNVNDQRILHMHEYAAPYINEEIFDKYTAVFERAIEEIISFPDRLTSGVTQPAYALDYVS